MRYFILPLIFLLLLPFSCNKEEIALDEDQANHPNREYLLNEVNRLSWGALGEAHNSGLELVYQDCLDPNNPVDGSSRDLISERVVDVMNRSYGVELSHEVHFPDHLRFALDLNMEERAAYLLENGMDDLTIFHLFNIYGALTLRDAKQTVGRLIELENVTLENEESNQLYHGCLDIAKASLYYWTHNLTDWQHKIITTTNQSPSVGFRQTWDAAGTEWFWNTVNTMTRNDVGGGLIAGLGLTNSSITLFEALFGVVEGSAIVSGALFVSASTGINEIIVGPGCPEPSGGSSSYDPTSTWIDYCWGDCTWDVIGNIVYVNCPCV